MELYYRIDFGDFELDVSLFSDIELSGVERKKLFKEELSIRLKDHHYNITTETYKDSEIERIYGLDLENDEWDHITNTIWDHDQPTYVAYGVTKLPYCEGCRLDAPGQRDHMDVGGCLYDPENPW